MAWTCGTESRTLAPRLPLAGRGQEAPPMPLPTPAAARGGVSRALPQRGRGGGGAGSAARGGLALRGGKRGAEGRACQLQVLRLASALPPVLTRLYPAKRFQCKQRTTNSAAEGLVWIRWLILVASG